MHGLYRAAVDDGTLYVIVGCQVFCYIVSTSHWSRLPDSLTSSCLSVIINNLLTLVGGRDHRDVLTNQLFSFTSGRKWTEEFPPMPTKRYGTTALCTEATLIIIAGRGKNDSKLQTVEVLNTKTLQRSTAADLPQPLWLAPASVCGDQIYILGVSNIMYTCSLQALIQSRKLLLANFRNKGTRVWKKVAAPPVTETTYVPIHGRLLAIGGMDSDRKSTSAIHIYNPTTDSWEVISHMGTPRSDCIAAVLPNNQLMAVSGYTTDSISASDLVEFAFVE